MTREETWKRLVGLRVVTGEMPAGQWNLRGADLGGADLTGAYFRDVNLGVVKSRYGAKMDADLKKRIEADLKKRIEKEYPHLFEKPDYLK
jgi:hypothetical protein